MDQEIRVFINKLRRRLSMQKTINILPIFLSIGFFIAFLHVLLGYFQPFYYAKIMGFVWIALSLLCGGIYLLLHFPKEQEAAHTGDRVIGQERLLTALELRGNHGTISCLQKEDTITHILNCNIKKAFPYQIPPKQILACFFAISLFLLFLFLPSNAKTKAVKLHALKQEIKAETALIKDMQKELEQGIESIEKKSSSQDPKTVGEKLAAYSKPDIVKELLEKTKEEYSLADSKQELQKAKERFQLKLSKIAENSNSLQEQQAITSFMKQTGLLPSNNESDEIDSNNDTHQFKNNESEKENPSNNSNQSGHSQDNQSEQTITKNNPNQNNSDGNHTNDASGNQDSNHKNTSDNKNNSNNKNSSNDKNENNPNSNSQDSNNQNENNENENNHQNNSKSNTSSNQNTNSNSFSVNNPNEKGSNPSSGKNQGSKKGIERKNKTLPSKEKIMVENFLGDDENLTGKSSKDGNSYMESSNNQLSFGTKKNLEDVAGDYASNAFTAIDNHSVPASMTEVVRTYFDIFYKE